MNSTSSAALLSLSSVARAAKIGLLLATVLASLAEIAPTLAQQPNSAETQWSNTSRQATANHAGPVTPSAKLNAPYPPQIVGCHHLENGKWQEVPCASEEYIRKHHIPRPLLANSIQSTPHGFIVFPNHPSGGVTSPLIWGSVAITFLSDPTQATETDGDSQCVQHSEQHQCFQLLHLLEWVSLRCHIRSAEFGKSSRRPRLGAIRVSATFAIITSLRVEYRCDGSAGNEQRDNP